MWLRASRDVPATGRCGRAADGSDRLPWGPRCLSAAGGCWHAVGGGRRL